MDELSKKISELVREAELSGRGNVYASDSLSLYQSDLEDYISKNYIPKSKVLEAIGEDEVRPSRGPKRNGIEQGLRRTRNKLRAELRQALSLNRRDV